MREITALLFQQPQSLTKTLLTSIQDRVMERTMQKSQRKTLDNDLLEAKISTPEHGIFIIVQEIQRQDQDLIITLVTGIQDQNLILTLIPGT